MRRVLAATLFAFALAGLALPQGAFAHGPDHHDGRKMEFPQTPSGGQILPVDLHTHSVFSDGNVWPSIRVEEAEKDGLAAMAVTEHVEYQPHAADIPHPDRNRAFAIAQAASKKDVLIINGAEITRSMPPGHVNAIFLRDVNAIKVEDAEASIRAANSQGAFVFWNHPYWTAQRPDGIALLEPMHRRLIVAGQLHGIEVANGADYSEAALRIALDNNLAILGASDVHGLIDWDFDHKAGEHRTVTLVLAKARTGEAIQEALKARRTVAWYRDMLIGRPREVEEVLRSSLSLSVEGLVEKSKLVKVKIRNASSVRYMLRVKPPTTLYTSGDLIIVPPMGEVSLQLSGGVAPANVRLALEAVNVITAPDQTFQFELLPSAPR
jgi:hypothetical protein